MPSIHVDIYDAYIRDGSPTFGKVKEESREPFRLVWTVPESGKYNLDVSSGDDLEQRDRFLYGLRLDRYRATGPANQRAVRTGGSVIQVSWNPVAGADYYNIYRDELFASGCRLAGDGSPSFCEELATNVIEIAYVHDNPGNDTNYYWVVACRPRECSKIDSVNPPISLETSPTGPTNTATPTEIQTPTPSNKPLPVSLPAFPTRLEGRQPK